MRFVCRSRSCVHSAHMIILAPVLRLQHSTAQERLLGVLGAAAMYAFSDPFAIITLLLVASGVMDTVYGRSVARSLGTFDQAKSEIGIQSKIMGILMVLLIRGFEAWWAVTIAETSFNGFHTAGFLSAAVAVTLFVNDLKSIEEKRVRYGQRPLPVLGRVLNLIDAFAGMLGAPAQGFPTIERRKTDLSQRESDQEEDNAN